ncbi:MAG: prepilin-type N-terminal cleavage/methylation domain-containing protein [Candidatus Pacebacteria bacterium]|nr:prepilin-type N-terminal cleavage/methylation domain-containing protein [Candidatus Paceibacterota bacterium]MBP9842662.1 prepilin-type N-terminal cleavage/methylation domain-containing protein [Candidatus Paceibacterota bacterium]
MSSLFSHSKAYSQVHTPSQAGFGLIELMVSIAVMAIVSSIILVRQNSFNGGVLLRSQAYEIALSAREVQLNAVSAVGVAGNFRTLQGLHFDITNNSVYRIFRDADNDGFFDPAESLGQQGSLDNRFEIRAIRLGGVSINEVSVVFERPNFDARFFSAPNNEVTTASSVQIDIATRGVTGTSTNVLRTLEITSTGQIIVQ